MPVLKNARHETFAQGLAKGLTADEAYQSAGYKPHRGNASTLRANQSILDRVTELQSKAVKKVEITVDSLAQELEEARAIALAEKQSSAAVLLPEVTFPAIVFEAVLTSAGPSAVRTAPT